MGATPFFLEEKKQKNYLAYGKRHMKIGAYQFPVGKEIEENLKQLKEGARAAAREGVRIVAFGECALTGYPENDADHIRAISVCAVDAYLQKAGAISRELGIYLLFGSVRKRSYGWTNCAFLACPDGMVTPVYEKRALWGWDKDLFSESEDVELSRGLFEVEGLRFGVRICFEVRFPEYFRELYRFNPDAVFVLFNDRDEGGNPGRYGLITAHLRTRAVENVYPIVSVNTSLAFQCVPTASFNEDGSIISELALNQAGLLTYTLEKTELSFGAAGRRYISDRLTRE